MKKITALRIIFAFALAGTLFSGYFSYSEVIMKVCPVGWCASLFGISVCIYGLVMYAVILAASLIALLLKKK